MNVAKQILDEYATEVIFKDGIHQKNGRDVPNADKSKFYTPEKYSEDIVLWKCPNNWIRIEFDGIYGNDLKSAFSETVSNLNATDIEYFITEHSKESSPYINIPNIRGLPLNQDCKQAKMLFLNELLSQKTLKNLDKGNLTWSWTPVIGHSHWKTKYNGAEHRIIRGENPTQIENNFPKEFKAKLSRAKKKIANSVSDIKKHSEWVEDFLLNYCCNNELPSGERHTVINKNLAILLSFREDFEKYIDLYDNANGDAGSVKGWLRKAISGDYTEVNPLELKKYINDNDVPYTIVEKPLIEGESLDDTISFFTDKRNLAEQFYKKQPFYYDKGKNLWLWNNTDLYWREVDQTDLFNAISKCSRADTISSRDKNEILEAFKQVGRYNQPRDLPENTLQIGKNLVNVITGEIMKSTAEYFSTNRIPHNLGDSDETPILDKLFADWLGKEKQLFLQEIAIYCMLPDYPIHRIFCLVGEGSNGKSTFIRFIHKLVGANNACSVSMDGIMTNRFEAWNMYRKLLAEMGETNYDSLKRTDMLKKLSGQDSVTFERKGADPISAKNNAKIVISTNSVPETNDRTDGFYRRWLTVIFNRKFPDGRDILQDVPEYEYENFCRKAIKILGDLLQRGQFHEEPNLEEKKKQYDELSNPLMLFIKKQCDMEINGHIFKYEFRDKFQAWCNENKFREHNDKEIGLKLKDLELETKKVTTEIIDDLGNLKRYNAWMGIAWKNKEQKQDDAPFKTQHVEKDKSRVFQFINEMPENNKRWLITAFGEEKILRMLKFGDLMEYKPGTVTICK